jgi:hypothetical protein
VLPLWCGVGDVPFTALTLDFALCLSGLICNALLGVGSVCRAVQMYLNDPDPPNQAQEAWSGAPCNKLRPAADLCMGCGPYGSL